MVRRLLISILMCMITVFVIGCGENNNSSTKLSTLKLENEELISEKNDLKNEIEVLKTENQNKSEQIEELRKELQEKNITEKSEETSNNDLEVLSLLDGGEVGPIIKYNYNGKELEQELDISSIDMYSLYPTNSGFEYEMGDLTGDGIDDLLINMYVPNNVSETICSSYIYILNGNNFECSRTLDALLTSDEQFRLYGDVHIDEGRLSLTGFKKDNGEFITENGFIECIDSLNNDWYLIK